MFCVVGEVSDQIVIELIPGRLALRSRWSCSECGCWTPCAWRTVVSVCELSVRNVAARHLQVVAPAVPAEPVRFGVLVPVDPLIELVRIGGDSGIADDSCGPGYCRVTVRRRIIRQQLQRRGLKRDCGIMFPGKLLAEIATPAAL